MVYFSIGKEGGLMFVSFEDVSSRCWSSYFFTFGFVLYCFLFFFLLFFLCYLCRSDWLVSGMFHLRVNAFNFFFTSLTILVYLFFLRIFVFSIVCHFFSVYLCSEGLCGRYCGVVVRVNLFPLFLTLWQFSFLHMFVPLLNGLLLSSVCLFLALREGRIVCGCYCKFFPVSVFSLAWTASDWCFIYLSLLLLTFYFLLSVSFLSPGRKGLRVDVIGNSSPCQFLSAFLTGLTYLLSFFFKYLSFYEWLLLSSVGLASLDR